MEIGIIIDTNRYRDFVDGLPETVAVFRTAGRICVPFVVVAELRAGFAVGTHSARNESRFQQFLHRPRVEVLFSDLATTRHYAHLYRQLRTAGTPIPTNDMWIAALVLQNELPLYSRDAHFDVLPQLPRI